MGHSCRQHRPRSIAEMRDVVHNWDIPLADTARAGKRKEDVKLHENVPPADGLEREKGKEKGIYRYMRRGSTFSNPFMVRHMLCRSCPSLLALPTHQPLMKKPQFNLHKKAPKTKRRRADGCNRYIPNTLLTPSEATSTRFGLWRTTIFSYRYRRRRRRREV